jgi:hypothetical protein
MGQNALSIEQDMGAAVLGMAKHLGCAFGNYMAILQCKSIEFWCVLDLKRAQKTPSLDALSCVSLLESFGASI